jgi:hypothetical protein
MPVSVGPSTIRPAGISTFCAATARATSRIETSYASSRSASTSTWISRSRAPMKRTAPTPGVPSRRSFTCLRAISVSSLSVRSPVTVRNKIGVASMSNLSTTGGSVPSGSFATIVATLSRTSCAATSSARSM